MAVHIDKFNIKTILIIYSLDLSRLFIYNKISQILARSYGKYCQPCGIFFENGLLLKKILHFE